MVAGRRAHRRRPPVHRLAAGHRRDRPRRRHRARDRVEADARTSRRRGRPTAGRCCSRRTARTGAFKLYAVDGAAPGGPARDAAARARRAGRRDVARRRRRRPNGRLHEPDRGRLRRVRGAASRQPRRPPSGARSWRGLDAGAAHAPARRSGAMAGSAGRRSPTRARTRLADAAAPGVVAAAQRRRRRCGPRGRRSARPTCSATTSTARRRSWRASGQDADIAFGAAAGELERLVRVQPLATVAAALRVVRPSTPCSSRRTASGRTLVTAQERSAGRLRRRRRSRGGGFALAQSWLAGVDVDERRLPGGHGIADRSRNGFRAGWALTQFPAVRLFDQPGTGHLGGGQSRTRHARRSAPTATPSALTGDGRAYLPGLGRHHVVGDPRRRGVEHR